MRLKIENSLKCDVYKAQGIDYDKYIHNWNKEIKRTKGWFGDKKPEAKEDANV